MEGQEEGEARKWIITEERRGRGREGGRERGDREKDRSEKVEDDTTDVKERRGGVPVCVCVCACVCVCSL